MDKRIARADVRNVEGDAIQALTGKLGSNLASSATYAALLRHHAHHKVLSEGFLLHACILFHGAQHLYPPFLENLLLQTYGKCGAMEDAFSTFSHIHTTDLFSWNLLLIACAENGKHTDAAHVFHQMQAEGFFPNKHTFLSLVTVCAAQTALLQGKAVHACILGNGSMSDIVLQSALVNMYGKCRCVEDARKMFYGMSQRNVISWNAMMSTYAQLGQSRNALLLFEDMLLKGVVPSSVTYVSLVDACACCAVSDIAKLIHWCVVWGGFEFDVVVGTTLINMYGTSGDLDEAIHTFNRLPEKNVVTWNTIIEALASQGKGEEAFNFFKDMCTAHVMPNKSTFVSVLSACTKQENLVEGKNGHSCIIKSGIICDAVLDTALVTMYGKCGSLMDARAVYDAMYACDVVAWTAMMAAYIHHGQGNEVLLLIQKMPPGVLLDNVTFVSILDACAAEGALEKGMLIHTLVLDSGVASDIVVGTALVNVYNKCGKLGDAHSVFDTILGWDTVGWNAMIAAYAQHGQFKVATQVVDRMLEDGVSPDEVTLVCILTAFSHAGMVIEGNTCFCSMQSLYGISHVVDHCNCMLDLFGRSGWICEGEKMILRMPFQPSVASWMTLLSAYRVHFDLSGGECAAAHILELEPDFGAPFVILSNLYAVTG